MQLKKPTAGIGDLARSRQRERDAALLRATTELFAQEVQHDLDEVRRYEELAVHFLPKVAKDDRAFVAERLASSDDTPQAVVRMLARDAIEVAAPVIRHSPVLQAHDLLAVIGATGPEHHRLIASRPALDDQVEWALRLTGDAEVIDRLDQTRPTGPDTGGPLADRVRITAAGGGDLTGFDLNGFLGLDRKGRLRVLADCARRPPPDRNGDTPKRADRAFRSILCAAKAVGFARTGQREALAAAISEGLELSAKMVRACLDDTTGEPLAVLLKALRLEESQAQQVFLLASPAGRDTATFFPLADLFAGMEPSVAESLCEAWRRGGHTPRHEPLVAPDTQRLRPQIAPAVRQAPPAAAKEAKRA